MSEAGDFELEDVLYEERGGEEDAAGGSSDGEEQQHLQQHEDTPPSSNAPANQGVDIAGASSSHQSSTLHLDEEHLDRSGPTPSPPVNVPVLVSRHRTVAGSLHPAAAAGRAGGAGYARLGTSAPIAIPNMMNRWRADGGGGGRGAGGQPDAASTFIPPHQLSKQDDFMFSFTGASPSAALKRERLRTRNAILRSTGFLEPQAGKGPSVGAGALEAAAPLSTSATRTPVQSSLTAALTTIGEA